MCVLWDQLEQDVHFNPWDTYSATLKAAEVLLLMEFTVHHKFSILKTDMKQLS